MKVEFEILGEPVAKARPFIVSKGGKSWGITPTKTRNAEQALRVASLQHKPTIPALLFVGPIYLHVIFYMPIPKNMPKSLLNHALSDEMRHIKRPDSDNLVKLVKDAFNDVWWNDDSQICDLVVTKRYSGRPRTEITINYLG